MILSTFITLLSLACASRQQLAATTDRAAVVGDGGCSYLSTCAACTSKPEAACRWSVARQECVSTAAPEESGNPTAAEPSDCPRVRVVYRTVTEREFEYRVRVSDDRIGMAVYLRDHAGGVACVWETGVRSPARVEVDSDFDGTGGHGGYVVCDPVLRDRFGPDRHLPYVKHFRLAVGPAAADNVTLRMDNEKDYYTSFYHSDCGGTVRDRCVECAWTDDVKRYYLAACSSSNVCAVQPSMKMVYVNSQYLKYRGGGRGDREMEWPSDVRTRCDGDIVVTSLEPALAPWNADKPIEIKMRIKNLSVLAERFFVWDVTVAGKWCTDVVLDVTEGGMTDVLTCKLSPGRHAVTSGPARVRFVSPSAAASAIGGAATATSTTFVVESAIRFRFDGPVVTGASGPRCGPLRGGTVLTVHGSGFGLSGNVTVTVRRAAADGEPAGPLVPCAVTARADDRVTCATGPSAVLSAEDRDGTVTVTFDHGLALAVPRMSFAYAADPALQTSQTLSGIAAGGNSVPVNWRSVACVDEATVRMYAQRRGDGARFYSDCLIVDSTLTVCRAPAVQGLQGGETEPPGSQLYPLAQSAPALKPVERFGCGFEIIFAGSHVHVPCGPMTAYYAYDNPAYAGFVVGPTDAPVVLVGRDSGLGYVASDVSVMLPLDDPAECVVLLVDRDRIECVPPEAVRGTRGLTELKEVWVTVGSAPPVVVPRLRGFDL